MNTTLFLLPETEYLADKLDRLDTREKIICLGEALFQQFGYNGFSYKHISSQLGIKNAAIHYHFPTKSDLGLAILQHSRKRFHKWKLKMEKVEMNTPIRMEKYIDDIYGWQLTHGDRICLIASSSTDFRSITEDMQLEAKALAEDIQNLFVEVLEEGRANNLLSFEGDVRKQALNILLTLQGSLLTARIYGKKVFDIAKEQIMINLKPRV